LTSRSRRHISWIGRGCSAVGLDPLVYCLVGIARMCLRHAFTAGDGPRSARLFFVASGSAFAAVAAFAAGTGMLLRYSTGAARCCSLDP